MLGAIAGDVIGSTFEFEPTETKRFELFAPGSFPTDDSILTLAVASWLLGETELVPAFKRAVREHPHAGWGGMFRRWAATPDPEPYNSFGNGSAMRVSPVGFACTTLEQTLATAARSAAVTHDHPEGVRGAEATAMAVFLARHGADKAQLHKELETRFGYDLSRPYDVVREACVFDETCQVSVPEAIVAFLASDDFEDAVRNAVWLGGDADTQACIAGGIAEAFYGGVPEDIAHRTMEHLEAPMRELVQRFSTRFGWPHLA